MKPVIILSNKFFNNLRDLRQNNVKNVILRSRVENSVHPIILDYKIKIHQALYR